MSHRWVRGRLLDAGQSREHPPPDNAVFLGRHVQRVRRWVALQLSKRSGLFSSTGGPERRLDMRLLRCRCPMPEELCR
jgi:hypothetical protein